MNTITTTPAVKVSTDPVMAGDVFYGSFDTTIKGKRTSIMVSNHIKDENGQYEFRIANKCKAGFVNIHEIKGTPLDAIGGWAKNALVTVQVKHTYDNGKTLWFNVFTTKSGKWYSIDLGFLKVLTVGNMRTSFPDMCDMNLWEMVGAKTWADKAFTQN
jgi:hypothetical protein